MKKRIVSLALALMMCFSLSVTAFATEEETTAPVEPIEIEVDEDGYFEFIVPAERINANGSFTAEFKRYLLSDHFIANNTYLSVNLESWLTQEGGIDPDNPPEDTEYADGSFDLTLYGHGNGYSDSRTCDLYSTRRVIFYDLEVGDEYFFEFSTNQLLMGTDYYVYVKGSISNITVVD